jgi:hypothetical protein
MEDSQRIFHKKSVNRSRKGEKEENLFLLLDAHELFRRTNTHTHSQAIANRRSEKCGIRFAARKIIDFHPE